jgi:CCR4-NOT transcriptional regulation complex NOT5 subunit
VHLIPNKMPAPRLLSSVVPEIRQSTKPGDEPASRFVLKGVGIFCGNGRAIFAGILAGVLLISIAGWIFSRHNLVDRESAPVRKLMHATTHSVSASPHSTATPAPIIVQISSDSLRVSAIALGHPRLAVINGQQVAEGDTVTLHTPMRSVAVTLRVIRIADGRIDLSDGLHVLTARLTVPSPTPQNGVK